MTSSRQTPGAPNWFNSVCAQYVAMAMNYKRIEEQMYSASFAWFDNECLVEIPSARDRERKGSSEPRNSGSAKASTNSTGKDGFGAGTGGGESKKAVAALALQLDGFIQPGTLQPMFRAKVRPCSTFHDLFVFAFVCVV